MNLLRLLIPLLTFTPVLSRANSQACSRNLIEQFNVEAQKATFLCAMGSVFIQQCMTERPELISPKQFDSLAEECLAKLERASKRQEPNDMRLWENYP